MCRPPRCSRPRRCGRSGRRSPRRGGRAGLQTRTRRTGRCARRGRRSGRMLEGSLLFLTLVNLLIDAAHIPEERAHLLGAEPGATGLERHFDAVGHDQMAPDLDRARAPGSRWQRPGRRLLQHFTDSLQGQPRQLPFANQQELLDMVLRCNRPPCRSLAGDRPGPSGCSSGRSAAAARRGRRSRRW